MAEQGGGNHGRARDSELAAALADAARGGQKMVADFLERHRGEPGGADPFNLGGAFLALLQRMLADPARLVEAQVGLWHAYVDLWSHASKRLMGIESAPVATPAAGDRRFRHADWNDSPIFDLIKQSYLVTARWLQRTVAEVDGLDEASARKVEFYTRQFVDAIAPTNFPFTNPEVLRATIEQRGENLTRGLGNLLRDLEDGQGRLKIRMTDLDAFEVGKNLALAPGKVVYRNALIELIQYAPTTETVHRRPLLIIPPWINKYYILDLQPKNSMVAWLRDQGYTVFMVSWVNPDAELARKSFEDYLSEGALAALDAIEAATGEREVNVIGYCLGGTLLACLMAYLAAKGDTRVVSATYMAALVDFAEAGELSVFIDEEQLARLESRMNERGYLEGHEMATTFNLLRANDLIWSFVINNYLLGKDPFPFDLLYWNSDSTRMPAAMHSFYLRNMYKENRLVVPGAIRLAGVDIDLGRIRTPSYVLAAREDHIAPWRSTFAAVRLYGGEVRFVLAGSGHIAGVVNPPAANKYAHWVNADNPGNADGWLAGASEVAGSWWTDWFAWNASYRGDAVAPRAPGDGALAPLADAPGDYVKARA